MLAATHIPNDLRIRRSLLLVAVPVTAAIGVGLSFWKIYAFHLVVLVLGGILVADALRRGTLRPLTRSRLPLMLYGLLGWCVLSVVWSIKPEYTAVYAVYVVLGIVVVLSTIACTGTAKRFRRLVHLLTIVFTLEIVIVMVEVSFGVHWLTSTLSPYAGYLGKESGEAKFLFAGFGRNPNNVAVTMLVMIPLAICCLRGYWRYVFSALAVSVVLMSGSRASLIGLLMMALSYLGIARGARWALASTIMAVCTVWILLSLPAPAIIHDLSQATMRYLSPEEGGGTGDSIAVRRMLIAQGMEALADTRGIGLGAGGAMAIPEYLGAAPGTKAAMHNFWFEMLVDTGVLFFSCFVLWYLYLLYRLWRIARAATDRRIRRIAAGTFLAMTGFTFGVISVSTAIYFLPMWILLGLAISAIEMQRYRFAAAQSAVARITLDRA